MIFLSDGECSVPDTAIQDICRCAVRLGCVQVTFFLLQIDHSLRQKEAAIFPFYLFRTRRFVLFSPEDGQPGPRSPE